MGKKDDSKIVSTYVTSDMHEELTKLAKSSYMTLSQFVRILLSESIEDSPTFKLHRKSKEDEMFGLAIAAEPHPPASKKYRKPGKHDPIPKPGKAN